MEEVLYITDGLGASFLRAWYNNSADAELKTAELSYRHFMANYTTHGSKSKCPCGTLPFLRAWYNNFADAEFKAVRKAVLSRLREFLSERLQKLV